MQSDKRRQDLTHQMAANQQARELQKARDAAEVQSAKASEETYKALLEREKAASTEGYHTKKFGLLTHHKWRGGVRS